MTMNEDEIAAKARKEFRKLSEEEQTRKTKSKTALRKWLGGLWEGAKSIGKSLVNSLANLFF